MLLRYKRRQLNYISASMLQKFYVKHDQWLFLCLVRQEVLLPQQSVSTLQCSQCLHSNFYFNADMYSPLYLTYHITIKHLSFAGTVFDSEIGVVICNWIVVVSFVNFKWSSIKKRVICHWVTFTCSYFFTSSSRKSPICLCFDIICILSIPYVFVWCKEHLLYAG